LSVSSNDESAPSFAAPERPRRVVGGPRENPLERPELEWLREKIHDDGLTATSIALDAPQSTVANAAAGAGLRRANRIFLTDRIRAARAAR
jgi:hypothetical protein